MERLPVFVSEHEGGTSKHREQSKAASLCKEATFRSLIRMEEYQLCKFAKVWNSQSSGLACQQVCVTLLPKDGVGEWGGGARIIIKASVVFSFGLEWDGNNML